MIGQALTKKGQVWAWGQNLFGQLGDGTTRSGEHPKLVRLSDMRPSFPGLVDTEPEPQEEKKVFAIACGSELSIAVIGTS